MMLRNFHALAGLSMLFLVSACGAAAPDSEELVGQESSDLFSCNPAVGLAPAVPGGPTSIGSSSPDSVIVSIQGTGPTLTFTQRSISTGQTTTTSFALGLNVTATGGIGSPTSLTYIEAMYTSTNSWNFTERSGTRAAPTMVFPGPSPSLVLALTRVSKLTIFPAPRSRTPPLSPSSRSESGAGRRVRCAHSSSTRLVGSRSRRRARATSAPSREARLAPPVQSFGLTAKSSRASQAADRTRRPTIWHSSRSARTS